MNELKAAVREQRDEIERIAAGLVRAGIPRSGPRWNERGKSIANGKREQNYRNYGDSKDGPSDNNSRLGRSLREGTDT